MGFLDNYSQKYRLDELPSDTKKRLEDAERQIENKINNNKTPATFKDVVNKHADQIVDLVDRVSAHFENWKFSKIVSTFKFVFNIGIEVYQIIDNMKGSIITDDMSPQEQYLAKIELGKDLVYFIWLTVDPFKDRWNWIPFKKTLEKAIVKWLAAMALAAAMDLINANAEVAVFTINKGKKRITNKRYLKALS